MTEQQLVARFALLNYPFPTDARERVWRRIQAQLRRQRLFRLLRRVAIVLILFLLFSIPALASPVPHTIQIVVVDAAGAPMPDTLIDVRWTGPNTSAVTLATTDANGYVYVVAEGGQTVTVRVVSNPHCHQARWVVSNDEPRKVAPGCGVWLPAIFNNSVEGVDAATRFWGG